MSQRTKHVVLIILAQAGCLAVGLLMHFKFLGSAVGSEAVNRAWPVLEQSLERTLADQTGGPEPGPLVAAAVDPGVVVTTVDDQWRLRTSTFVTEGGQTLASGSPVGWTQTSPRGGGAEAPLRGTLALPDGEHLAVARRLPDQRGYIIFHRSSLAVRADAQRLLESAPALAGLTFLWTLAMLGVLAYMLLARFHDDAERERSRSVAEGLRQRQELVRTRDAVVFGLAKLADSRDADTGDHLERISVYCTMLANVLRRHPRYAHEVTPAFVRLIGISSALHDIGKVGITDSILRNPGDLTPQERAQMQSHTVIGGDCLRQIERRLGSSNFLHMARQIALAHHERWDGTGYPDGLMGEQIPLTARIVAIADVYDALASTRVYKQPSAHEECVRIIRDQAGTQFDPDLVEAWLTIAPRFAEVARRYSAPPGDAVGPGPPGEGVSDSGLDTEPAVDPSAPIRQGRRAPAGVASWEES